jgi:hypothetical protein
LKTLFYFNNNPLGMNESSKFTSAEPFRIVFDMDEIEKVPPWGKQGECKLHWYGLTSGRFWFETTAGNPLEYTAAIQDWWSLRCKNPDYFVARLFEDLLSILPLVLEPVPADIAARVANPVWRVKAEHWRDAEEDELRWDRWYSATQWWHDRTLDLGYLQHAPELAFWRTGNQVFFQWQADKKADGIPVWILPQGQISMAASSFEAAVSHFCEDLLWSMGNRVRSIQKAGWKRADCTLNVEELAKEHAVRRDACHSILHEQRTTDWEQIRASLDVFLALMGEPMTNGT